MRKLLALPLLLLFASVAYGAGGACPTGANYTNPSAPIGALVTLSSLGITSCFYVADNGSDANLGTTEAQPWLHAPGMANCTNKCSASVLVAGIGIIFKGGDTWHFGNSALLPYAGNVSNCWSNGTQAGGFCTASKNGTGANPIYIGVDQGWFSGASWTRPIFTADNPICGPNNVDGVNCIHGTLPSGSNGTLDQYYLPGAACPVHFLGNNNDLIVLSNASNQIWDNLEVTGMCLDTHPNVNDNVYVRYSTIGTGVVFMNMYVHGASHIQFVGNITNPSCSTNVCANQVAFKGGNGSGAGESILFDAIDFQDSDPASVVSCFGQFYYVAYTAIRYTTSCVNNFHVAHDMLIEFFFEDGHSNVWESNGDFGAANSGTISLFYNNVIRHVDNSGMFGSVGIWPLPASGNSSYFFNNVIYDVGQAGIGGNQYLNVGNHNNNIGSETWFNNTFQTNFNQAIYRCNLYAGGTLKDINNHYIDDGGQYLTAAGQSSSNTCPNSTSTTNLLRTNPQATTDGYTSAQTFAYSPPASNSITVGTGTNETSICTTLGASSDPLVSAAQTSCQEDTDYGVVYNATSHTVTFPARTDVLRPTSGAWDQGAYEFSSVQPPPTPKISFSPNPLPLPTPVIGTGGSGAPITISNPGTATTTITSITITGLNASSFTEVSSTCSALPISITAGGSCNIIINFNPLVPGTYAAQANFFDNVVGSPQSVNLTGIGISPNVASPVGVFGADNLGGCAVCTGTSRCICFTKDGLYVSNGGSLPYVVIP